MKNKYKIIFTTILMFIILTCLNRNVYAVELGYRAWRYDVNNDGKPDLLFRRYSSPSDELLAGYVKNKSSNYIYKNGYADTYTYIFEGSELPSKWIYVEEPGVIKPTETSFSTIGYTFHTEKATRYTGAGIKSTIVGMHSTKYTTENLEDVATFFNNATNNATLPVINESIPAVELGNIDSKIYETYGVAGTLKSINWGTGININTLTPRYQMIYRYAIVSHEGKNIYIEDRVIYHEELQELRAAINGAKQGANINANINNDIVRISDIVISGALYEEGGYELAKTAAQFFKQYKKNGYTASFWPEEVRGTAEDSTQSVINVFDNYLQLPQTSKKNVIVRHINLGETTVLSENTMASSTRISADTGVISLKNSKGEVVSNVYSQGASAVYDNGTYYLAEEVYRGNIEVYNNISKSSVVDYACIGYNVATANSLSEAIKDITKNIQRGKYTQGTIAEHFGKVEESDTEWVVIDFYYTEDKEKIYVNHLLVNGANKILSLEQQTIKANDIAYVGQEYTGEIRALTNSYHHLETNASVVSKVQERYYRYEGQKILVKTALSLLDENNKVRQQYKGIIYKGYETFKTYTKVSDFVGYNAKLSGEWYNSFDDVLSLVVEPDQMQVNIYYYIEDKTEAAIPQKLLAAKYMLITDKYTGKCTDEGNQEVDSIPTGVKARAGVINLAKVMVSAIQLEYVAPSDNVHEFDMNMNYQCGGENLELNISNIQYSFGYFRVTGLVADALNQIVMYDASPKWSATSGTGLFNWPNDKNTLNVAEKANIKIIGDNPQKPINNTYEEITNWKNYVKITIKDKLGNEVVVTDQDRVEFKHEYLTDEEMDAMDVNKDNKIDEADKYYAIQLTDKYNEEYEDLEEANKHIHIRYEEAQKNIEDALKEVAKYEENLKALESTMNGSKEEYEKAVQALEDAKTRLDEEQTKLQGLENELATFNEQLEQQQADLSHLENDVASSLGVDLAGAKEKIKQLEESKRASSEEKERLEKEQKDYETEKASLEAKVNANEVIVSTHEILFSENKCEDYVYDGIYSDAPLNCIQIKKELKNAKDKLEEADKELADFTKTTVNNEDAIKELEDYLSSLEDELTTTKATETEIQELINNNAVAIQGKKDEIGITETHIAELEENIADSKEKIKTAKNDIVEAEMAKIQAYNEYMFDLRALNLYKETEGAKVYEIYAACGDYLAEAQKPMDWLLEAMGEFKERYENAQAVAVHVTNNLDGFQAKYDEFQDLKEKFWLVASPEQRAALADYFGMTMTIEVYNMQVILNGTSLNNPEKLCTTETVPLSRVILNGIEVNAPEVEFIADAYNGVGEKITENYYKTKYEIGTQNLNGTRTLAAEAKYNTTVLIGEHNKNTKISSIKDNVYYSTYVDEEKEITDGTFIIDYQNLTASVSRKVNVYTPILVSAKLQSDTDKMVDQTQSNISASSTQTIQLGVPFTVTLNSTGSREGVYRLTDTSKFCKGYYVKFDFDIHNVYLNDNLYNNGEVVKAGTWIGLIATNKNGATTLKANVYANVEDATIDIAEEGVGSYVVRAVANNANASIMNQSKKYLELLDMLDYNSGLRTVVENICTNPQTTGKAEKQASYFAQTQQEVVLLNRLYDFRITDAKDLSWKSVFRTTQNSVINVHTGKVYYSGIKKWSLGNNNSNTIERRTASEIGSFPQRILPLGAYKHTDARYIKAPKLGYGFSFDMKVTGNYYGSDGNPLTNKYVDIKTSFYYVSDDGNTFLQEGKNGIYLFYKNDSGKYVRIDENGGGYKLSFVPNDGYRLIDDAEKTELSTKSVELGNLRNIKLLYNMATVDQLYSTSNVANNGMVITYYGEYKLPNSTIAVEVDEYGNYNINKPLTHGYIGVIFDITAKAGTYGNRNNQISLSYDQNTKSQQNTSQWDYEGYLGINNPGNAYSTTMKLEGGTWNITNDIYKKIKGTVILYDIDERAANDYQ